MVNLCVKTYICRLKNATIFEQTLLWFIFTRYGVMTSTDSNELTYDGRQCARRKKKPKVVCLHRLLRYLRLHYNCDCGSKIQISSALHQTKDKCMYINITILTRRKGLYKLIKLMPIRRSFAHLLSFYVQSIL